MLEIWLRAHKGNKHGSPGLSILGCRQLGSPPGKAFECSSLSTGGGCRQLGSTPGDEVECSTPLTGVG